MGSEVIVQERPDPGPYAVIDSANLRRLGRMRVMGMNCHGEIILKPDKCIILNGQIYSVVLASPNLVDEIGPATIDDVLANWQVER